MTRHLLGGAIDLGFDVSALAAAVGSSPAATRNRAMDGPVELHELRALGIVPEQLDGYPPGMQSASIVASALLAALLSQAP